MTEFTPRDVDEALRAFGRMEQRRGPTVREFRRALGLSSTSVAHYRVRDLVARGLLEQIDVNGNRGYRLTEAGQLQYAAIEAGRVAAAELQRGIERGVIA